MKRIASHFLILSPDIIYKKQVIEIYQQRLIQIFPLEEELESVFWMSGVIFLSSQKIDLNEIKKKLKKAINENLIAFLSEYASNVKIGNPVYAYFFNSVELSTFLILDETSIEEL
ncbi:hypothetical protein [uncultured Bacteroides sp.]|uniref:hypothetical protein n=1 Tax=uncultured Bacteroides sp. TaxID=162156 RepID=UPI002AABF488|nr:hypothetical protein [uncultured Bacteroides sp.]